MTWRMILKPRELPSLIFTPDSVWNQSKRDRNIPDHLKHVRSDFGEQHTCWHTAMEWVAEPQNEHAWLRAWLFRVMQSMTPCMTLEFNFPAVVCRVQCMLTNYVWDLSCTGISSPLRSVGFSFLTCAHQNIFNDQHLRTSKDFRSFVFMVHGWANVNPFARWLPNHFCSWNRVRISLASIDNFWHHNWWSGNKFARTFLTSYRKPATSHMK